MKYTRTLLIVASVVILSACATSPTIETVDAWHQRTGMAWKSMSDNGNPAIPLDGLHVQNGMSTPNSTTFIVFPPRKVDAAQWSGENWPEDEPIVIEPGAVNTRVRCERAGSVFRCIASGLAPGKEYTLKVGEPEKDKVTVRTAPAEGGLQPDTSLVLLSCNEPWSQPRLDENHDFPRVSMSSANGLRLLDLRSTGKIPVRIGKKRWSKPDFLLGLGDQAYVDAAPNNKGSLALFAGNRSNLLQLDIEYEEQWEPVLDRIYRMHFFVPTFARPLQHLPNAMVWDDHEIRDGWGSQRDEDGVIQRYDAKEERWVKSKVTWAGYFKAAKKKSLSMSLHVTRATRRRAVRAPRAIRSSTGSRA